MATERLLSAAVVSTAPRAHVPSTVLSDYWAMTKPDVNLLIVITTAAAFCLALPTPPAPFPWPLLVHTLAGTVLVASGAATLNQWMERDLDARMRRTARRPVAGGRIEPGRALLSGMLLSVAGLADLLVATGPLPSLLAAITLLAYLFLYTPAKRRTPLCMLIGAVPGAIPPLIGWAAARGHLDLEAWGLFGIVFLWQFPHFMAIAWMYRDDYDRAGYRVLPAGEARTRFVDRQTLLPLVALVPVSLLPVMAGRASALYGVGALLLGLAFCACGAWFVARRSGSSARRLLAASILYLPLLLALMLVPAL
jgi:protoheme IX farnesyltransferase